MTRAFFVTLEPPSPDNRARFAQYARDIKAQLQVRYSQFCGYQIKELKPRIKNLPEWNLALYMGWSCGALVRVAQDRHMTHIAQVTVCWHSRVKQLVRHLLTVAGSCLLFAFLVFGRLLGGRLILVLFLSLPVFLVYAGFVIMCASVAGGLVNLLGGDRFDDDRLEELTSSLRQVPLPASRLTQPTAVTT